MAAPVVAAAAMKGGAAKGGASSMLSGGGGGGSPMDALSPQDKGDAQGAGKGMAAAGVKGITSAVGATKDIISAGMDTGKDQGKGRS